MNTLQFESNVKHDEKKRLAFNQLALDTFSINFESWFKRGMWNDYYIPFSYFDGDQCVANASYNPMTLIIDGEIVRGIQIGTVMTHPDYRGKGLAQKLIERIIEDTTATCDLYFLCAEESASNLYKRCGFSYRHELNYSIDTTDYTKLDIPLKPVQLSPEQLGELKLKSVPLSNYLSAVDDVHVAHFYYHLGFDQMIYQPEEQIFVIFEIENNQLNLYEIYAKEKITLEELIPLITPSHITEINCLFTPEPKTKGLKQSPGNTEWMVRPNPKTLPQNYKFPSISKT